MITAALTVGTAHHRASMAFCNRLIADGAIVSFSELTTLEIMQFYRTLAGRLDTEAQRRQDLHHWDTRPHVRATWLERGFVQFQRLTASFDLARAMQLRRQLAVDARALMASCNLPSYDAAHVATALAASMTDLAAVDAHFARAGHLLHVHIVRDG